MTIWGLKKKSRVDMGQEIRITQLKRCCEDTMVYKHRTDKPIRATNQ